MAYKSSVIIRYQGYQIRAKFVIIWKQDKKEKDRVSENEHPVRI